MSSHSGNGDSIRRYLLGELPEQEREQVEQRLMTDDELYQHLLLAEDDLIDEYASGSLSGHELAKFSRRFMHVPELRQDVKSVMALRKYAREAAPEIAAGDTPARPPFSLFEWLSKFFMRPAVGFAFAAAALLTVGLALWLGVQNSRLRQQVAQLEARQPPPPVSQPELLEHLAAERLRNEKLSEELLRKQEELAQIQQTQGQQQQPTPTPRPDQPSGVSPVFAFGLSTGAMRDVGAVKKVSVPSGTREVRIRLDLAENSHRTYRAVLQIVGGREVSVQQGLRAVGGNAVVLRVPAKLLTPEDYEIHLLGLTPSGEYEEVSSYYFRVS